MENSEEIKGKRDAIKRWLSNKYNFYLVGIIILSLLIRLYFLINTKSQPLWWDEAEYGSMGKYFAGIVPKFDVNPQRLFLFPALLAFLFKIGIPEIFIKLVTTLVPSVVLVVLIYYLGKEMYNEKIGILAAFLASLSWVFLFWAVRLQPDFISVCFQVLSVIFMWKYWKNKGNKNVVLSGVFAALGYHFKVSGLLVPITFFVFILLKDRLSFLKNKGYWLFLLAFVATLIPQFIYSQLTFESPFSFITNSGYSDVAGSSTVPYGWYNLKFYITLTTPALDSIQSIVNLVMTRPILIYNILLFILFLIGVFISLKFLFYSDLLIKEKERFMDPDIYSILTFIVVSSFYIFYIKGTEDRWVFLWMPFIFLMIGKASIFVYRKILPIVKNKNYAIALALILLIAGSYGQLNHAKQLIDVKKDSYLPVKEAGMWLKENSNKEDIIFSTSYPQTTYYSERYARTSIANERDFELLLEQSRPRFLHISAFEATPSWLNNWMQNNTIRLKPVQAYFADQENKQPILIIYEIQYY